MSYDEERLEVQKLFSDEAFWRKAPHSTMQKFLREYSLHDSRLIGIDYNPYGGGTLFLRLDSFWIDPNLKKLDFPIIEGHHPRYSMGDPYICIYFRRIYQLQSDIYGDHSPSDGVLDGATTKIISDEQRAGWLDIYSKLKVVNVETANFLFDDNVHCTTLNYISGINHLHIIHNEPTLFLCIEDGKVLHLPDLD